MAFVGDVSGKKKDAASYSLYYWHKSEKASEILNNTSTAIPEKWEVSENGRLSFSENGIGLSERRTNAKMDERWNSGGRDRSKIRLLKAPCKI